MGPTRAIISHKNLIHNLKLIQKAVRPAGVMGVVKADGYGHGAIEIARTLIENGVTYLGVAFAEEGVQLRRAGITVPILVFGSQLPEFFDLYFQYDLDLTLSAEWQIEPLQLLCKKYNKKIRIQIKVDTGMGRVGFFHDHDRDKILTILKNPVFDVKGIYSHLSSADEEDLSYTYGQIERFTALRDFLTKHAAVPLLFHLANSAAIMRLPQARFDLVRPGVMLYGNPPGADFPLTWDLKEVMRFVSAVTSVKHLPAGQPVSYNRRYYTDQPTYIGIIPAGYADGYNRRLTNKGHVLIRGRRYPVVGTVCMDQFMVDLGPQTDVQAGDEVVLFGAQDKEHITIIEISRMLETIPYEVTCWVSRRVPRVHIK